MSIIISEKAPSTPFGRLSFVEVKEKVVKASLSTSSKNQDGTYKYSNWNATFLGETAFEKAKTLKDKDRIKVTSGKIDIDEVEKEGKKNRYTNLLIFNFEILESKFPEKTENVAPPADEDSLPF